MTRIRAAGIGQLTVRGFGPDLERVLRQLARSEGISLNESALRLLRKGAGLVEPGRRRDVVGSSLDHLAGTWSEDEERHFARATASLERIEQQLWGGRRRGRR